MRISCLSRWIVSFIDSANKLPSHDSNLNFTDDDFHPLLYSNNEPNIDIDATKTFTSSVEQLHDKNMPVNHNSTLRHSSQNIQNNESDITSDYERISSVVQDPKVTQLSQTSTTKKKPFFASPEEIAHRALKLASDSRVTKPDPCVRSLIDSQRTSFCPTLESLTVKMQSESRKLRELKSKLSLHKSGTEENPYVAPYARINPKLPDAPRLAGAVQTKNRTVKAGKLISDFRTAFTKLGEEQTTDEIKEYINSRIKIFLLHTYKLNNLIINAIALDHTFIYII